MPDPSPRLSTGVNYSWSKNKLSLPQKDSSQLSGYCHHTNIHEIYNSVILKKKTESIDSKKIYKIAILPKKWCIENWGNTYRVVSWWTVFFCSFSNLGNTCYMNAILQALFHLEPFTRDLVHINRRISRSLPQQSLYQSVFRIILSFIYFVYDFSVVFVFSIAEFR